MDFTRFAIENDRVTLVALVVICAAGYQAFLTAEQAEDPGFIIRTAVVRTIFPGANPERVEELVTEEVEKSLQRIPEIDFISSQSLTGQSIVFVNIREEFTDMRPIWDNVRRKVEDVVPDLPDEIRGPFVDDEFGDTFGTIIALTAEGYNYAEMREMAYSARDLLLRLPNAGKVDIHGQQDERIFVEYNNARLAELGLSVMQLQQILAERNILIPAGSVRTRVERLELEPSGNFDSVEELARTVISLPGREEFLYLEDIADIRRGYVDPPRMLMRANGRPALALAISVREGGNIVALGEAVKETIASLNADYPIGVQFELVAFQPQIVEQKVDDFVVNVLQSIAIVIGVMLLMLGLRTGLVVATLIPSAMLMALLVMGFLGIGLNQMSLAALIISLGLLVDNAIVMSESIMVEMAEGKPAVEAAVASAKELRVPLLISSLTTAAAFLPIYLAESSVGEYTSALFEVVSITLLSSWLLALTVIPLLCVMFLKVTQPAQKQSFNNVFYRSYRGALVLAMRYWPVTLLGSLGLFALSIYGMGFLPNIFFPPSDKTILTAEIESPVGTAIERTDEIVAQIEQFVTDELLANEERAEGIANWSSYIGQGAPRFTLSYSPEQPKPEYAFMILNASSGPVMPEIQVRLESYVRENFPDVVATVRLLQNGPIVDHPVEVRLMGDDQARLFEIVDALKRKMREIPNTKNVDDDWGLKTKKIVVDIDPNRARRSGITNQDVALSLQSVLSGYEVTDYREGNEIIPVTMRSVAADRQDIGKLETLNVYSQTSGRSAPLAQVADLEVEWQSSRIFRRDRLKAVTVYSSTEEGVTAEQINAELIPWLDEQSQNWPVGYYYEMGGEAEASGEGNESIGEKLPIAGLLIVLLLVGQFNSLRKMLIIILTIPLGMIGVVGGLLAAKSYFGFMTLLGVISLAGIVINNAIVLIDRINIEIEQNGLEPPMAVVEAAQRRFRPILLTTCTTVGGLIPLWLGGGPMFEPMAIAILFGLIFATALTLGFVPTLYSLFFRVSFKGFRYEGSND